MSCKDIRKEGLFLDWIIESTKSEAKWKKPIIRAIEKITTLFYQAPQKERSSLYLLQLIDKYWHNIPRESFQSLTEYYLLLAKVSDYLLTTLLYNQKSPLREY
ncbi:hypothetical protein [Priestia endophytica]|jgi:hypothetical protein|uniref:hypothetical protein n=1 Tax=Priestia endophytica TaxID=135735 RepID=UPI000F546123|nr:hypothetical protein [Priestia endophytica]MED4070971.1 hypothetical protein [Priestia endophytica]RPK16158.1 hypothetical protein FH5_01598 [Priestia endophytica]